MFSLIFAWINGWVNNRGAVDLRRHRAHYDVIVMYLSYRLLYIYGYIFCSAQRKNERHCDQSLLNIHSLLLLCLCLMASEIWVVIVSCKSVLPGGIWNNNLMMSYCGIKHNSVSETLIMVRNTYIYICIYIYIIQCITCSWPIVCSVDLLTDSLCDRTWYTSFLWCGDRVIPI